MIIGISFEEKIPEHYSAYDRFKANTVKKWTRSRYFHTEFIIGDYWVSANTDGIVKYDLRPLTDKYDYVFIDIDMTEKQYKKIINFIDAQIGTKYDWMGIYLSQFLGIGSHRSDKWFCSELVTKLLQLCLVEQVLDMQPHMVSPGDLFRRMEEMIFLKDASYASGKQGQEKLEQVFLASL